MTDGAEGIGPRHIILPQCHAGTRFRAGDGRGRALADRRPAAGADAELVPSTSRSPILSFLDKAGERLRPQPLSPCRAAEPLLPAADQPAPVARACGSVQLAALAPTTRLSIRAGAAAGTAIGLALGVLLPTVPCRSVIARDRAALWLGPDEWLIVAPRGLSDLAARAVKAAGDHPASIVDVSHRSRTLEITGPRAAWCLNAFCALDLDVHAFPVGMCTPHAAGQGGDRAVADRAGGIPSGCCQVLGAVCLGMPGGGTLGMDRCRTCDRPVK